MSPVINSAVKAMLITDRFISDFLIEFDSMMVTALSKLVNAESDHVRSIPHHRQYAMG